MDKIELINYWKDTANADYNTMIHLFESKDFHWCLFMGHLVIEKLIKAIYVKNINENTPKIHDLLRLAERANLEVDEDKQDWLDIITTFNINARYPDYKQAFYYKCTYEFTQHNLEKIKELRKWLVQLIEV